MTESKWEFIETEAKHAQARFPEWRHGQALFNILYAFHPAIANKIRGTEFDCFHRDERISDFKKRVIELLEESN
jgi:hypothetical protein